MPAPWHIADVLAEVRSDHALRVAELERIRAAEFSLPDDRDPLRPEAAP
jgi:hypothetical protein